MSTITRDFLYENGKNTVRRINHEEYNYEGRSYKVGWDSNLPGWRVYASYSLDCPDCHGTGSFPDSTQAFSFNRLCGLCFMSHNT